MHCIFFSSILLTHSLPFFLFLHSVSPGHLFFFFFFCNSYSSSYAFLSSLLAHSLSYLALILFSPSTRSSSSSFSHSISLRTGTSHMAYWFPAGACRHTGWCRAPQICTQRIWDTGRYKHMDSTYCTSAAHTHRHQTCTEFLANARMINVKLEMRGEWGEKKRRKKICACRWQKSALTEGVGAVWTNTHTFWQERTRKEEERGKIIRVY